MCSSKVLGEGGWERGGAIGGRVDDRRRGGRIERRKEEKRRERKSRDQN